MIDVLRGEAISIRIEPPRENSIELRLTREHGSEVHQAKRSNRSEGRWTISALREVLTGFLQYFLAQAATKCVFVSTDNTQALTELAERARDAEDFPEFDKEFLDSNESLRKKFEELQALWSLKPVDTWLTLQRLFVETSSEGKLVAEIDALLGEMYNAPQQVPRAVLSQLADVSIHKTLQREHIENALAAAGIVRRRSQAIDGESSWVRLVHPLQRATHLVGRDANLEELKSWWIRTDATKCWSFQGLGGSGKTALVERFVEWVRQTHPESAILAWSFYDDVQTDHMLDALSSWRAVTASRTPLLVLDGLERVQSTGVDGELRGSLLNKRLKVFLRRVVAGVEPCRVLITSRYPLPDLQSWKNSTYREIALEHLDPDDAVALLRTLGVLATHDELHQIAEECGYHALTLTVWGSYIRYYHGGVPGKYIVLDIRGAGGELPEAAMLNRCLQEHAVLLSENERQVMCQLAGEIRTHSSAHSQIVVHKLQALGLISVNASGSISVHPALREFFVRISGVPKEEIPEVAHMHTLELEEQPGSVPGECERCGEVASIESAYCENCGQDVYIPGEAEYVRIEDGHIVAFFQNARGDTYALQCPECESTELSYEFSGFCDYCQWMWDKDD